MQSLKSRLKKRQYNDLLDESGMVAVRRALNQEAVNAIIVRSIIRNDVVRARPYSRAVARCRASAGSY